MAAKAQNDRLDFYKCAAIFAVVFAHVPFPGTFGQGVCAVAKFSVPLFFLSSGYFSWGRGSERIWKRTWRTGKLLLWQCLLLLVLGCALAEKNGGTWTAYLRGELNPTYWKEMLLYQVFPLPYSWPVWFMAALFLVYLCWWGLTKLAEGLGKPLPYGILGVISLLLLLVHLSKGEFSLLLGGEAAQSQYLRNAWLDGLPFFALGCWMGQLREKLEANLRPGGLYVALCASTALAVWEFSQVGVVDVFVGTTLMAVALMALSLVRPEISSPFLRKTACFCGKNLTFYIYVIHIPLYGILKEWQTPVSNWVFANAWLSPIWIAALSTLLALWLYGLSMFWKEKRHENH